MTRINCVPVEELTRQHLLAEYRELPRVRGLARFCDDAPGSYCLGPGHVKFFYDKGKWLQRRFKALVREMERRGYKPQHRTYPLHPRGLNNDWEPSSQDMELNRARIAERLRLP